MTFPGRPWPHPGRPRLPTIARVAGFSSCRHDLERLGRSIATDGKRTFQSESSAAKDKGQRARRTRLESRILPALPPVSPLSLAPRLASSDSQVGFPPASRSRLRFSPFRVRNDLPVLIPFWSMRDFRGRFSRTIFKDDFRGRETPSQIEC